MDRRSDPRQSCLEAAWIDGAIHDNDFLEVAWIDGAIQANSDLRDDE